MNILLRESQDSDMPFLQEMLYEAVFWRVTPNRPTYQEAQAYPEVMKEFVNWGERDFDTAVIATIDSIPVGAVWYRCWTDDDCVHGYIDQNTPVLAIAVHRNYRHQGVGGKMIDWLVDTASKESIQKISLNVSKDNYAINLYRQQGFIEYAEKESSFTMVKYITAQ